MLNLYQKNPQVLRYLLFQPVVYANDGGNGEDRATEDAPAEVVQRWVVDCHGVGIPDGAEEDGEEEDGGDEGVEKG